MVTRSALVRFGKDLVRDMEKGRLSASTNRAFESLAGSITAAGELIDLVIGEYRKDEPHEGIVLAYVMLLERALEEVRYGIERQQADAIRERDALTARLLEAGRSGAIDAAALALVLRSFAEAKLEVDERLQQLTHGLITAEDTGPDSAIPEGADPLAELGMLHEGDVFASYLYIEQTAEAVPADMRVAMVRTLLDRGAGPLNEMAVGFLLSATPGMRSEAAGLLAEAASRKRISPVTMRRMIAIRNWVPATERAGIDAAIKAARRAGIECAHWPAAPDKVGAFASFFDGSGAHSVLLVSGDPEEGSASLCGVLGRIGDGVRDAWVRRGIPVDEIEESLIVADEQGGLQTVPLDYVREAIETFIAEMAAAGKAAPFGLLDVAETAGWSGLNPGVHSLEERMGALIAAIGAEAGEPGRIAEELEESGHWHDTLGILGSWFEDDAEVRGLIDGAATDAAAVQLLLDGPLTARRRKWSDMLVRAATASRAAGIDLWPGMVIVARELLGQRPLAEIPFALGLARHSIDAYRAEIAERRPAPKRKSKKKGLKPRRAKGR